MKSILVFGGTSEGRKIAETLSRNGIEVQVSVATDYGRQVMEENENLHILEGRLNLGEMKELCEKNSFKMIIDATHPFATEVSENIKKCALAENLPLVRFERNVDVSQNEKLAYVETTTECRDLLLETQGKILLTTGSKDLKIFCEKDELRERLVVRVLPGIESINLCYENNLEGKQIIAMQGPFSENMNLAQIEDYGISVLVTKESGKAGGEDSKITAAFKKGIKCIVIKNPSATKKETVSFENYFHCDSIEKVFSHVETTLDVKTCSQNRINVFLIGIGMGNRKTMTLEAAEKINEADCIFGAERMISAIATKAKKIPFYLSKDIVPMLKEFSAADNSVKNVCILFSGDSGFFSGAFKLKKDLDAVENLNVEVLPGISSMSYLASKCGLSYQDAEIISLHGIEENLWRPQLEKAITLSKKIFILTSGIDDIHKVADLILGYNINKERKYRIALGFQLSYENEIARTMDAEECLSLSEEGLYSAFLFTE